MEIELVNDELGILQKGDEVFIQVPATGINPVGGAAAATVVDYGAGSALKYVNGATNIAATAVALPANVDRTIAPTVRVGWACDANTGNVRFGITYQYLGVDDDCSASGTEILDTDPVSTVTDGYKFTSVELGLIPSDARICIIKFTRYGSDALDTTSGDVYVLGEIFAYTIGPI